jgi:hypothetical protein
VSEEKAKGASKKTRKRANPITYLKLTSTIAIGSWVAYAFQRVVELAYGNHDIYFDIGLVVAAVFLLVFFTLYLWAIDRHGWIAQMLGAGKEENSEQKP